MSTDWKAENARLKAEQAEQFALYRAQVLYRQARRALELEALRNRHHNGEVR